MKNKIILSLALLASLLYSCDSEDIESQARDNESSNIIFVIKGVNVTIGKTRASLSDSFSLLDLAIYVKETNGAYTLYKEVQQQSSNPNFGVVRMENVKHGTYRLVVLGHSDANHPNMEDPTDIAFTNYPMVYIDSEDISVDKNTTSKDVSLDHATAKFRFELSGYIPDDVQKVQFEMQGVSNTLNAITGLAVRSGARTTAMNVTANHRQNQALNVSCFTFLKQDDLTSATSDISIVVKGLDANDNVLDSSSFSNIPAKIGSTTKFSGVFFDYGSFGFNFTVNTSWGEYANLEF